MERAQSADVADHYLKVEMELQDFHSNKKGYIKRDVYNKTKAELDEVQKKLE